MKCTFSLNPGETKWCDSGFGTIQTISWGFRPDPSTYMLYRTTVKLWNLNVGAEFIIRDGGVFHYDFGIDKSGDGKAEVAQQNK